MKHLKYIATGLLVILLISGIILTFVGIPQILIAIGYSSVLLCGSWLIGNFIWVVFFGDEKG